MRSGYHPLGEVPVTVTGFSLSHAAGDVTLTLSITPAMTLGETVWLWIGFNNAAPTRQAVLNANALPYAGADTGIVYPGGSGNIGFVEFRTPTGELIQRSNTVNIT